MFVLTPPSSSWASSRLRILLLWTWGGRQTPMSKFSCCPTKRRSTKPKFNARTCVQFSTRRSSLRYPMVRCLPLLVDQGSASIPPPSHLHPNVASLSIVSRPEFVHSALTTVGRQTAHWSRLTREPPSGSRSRTQSSVERLWCCKSLTSTASPSTTRLVR